MDAIIQIKDVNKTYHLGDEDLHALAHVNLTINAGDFVALIGPSGSGKSTLANIIGGLDRPDSGTIVVDGIDLSKAHDRKLSEYRNKHIGFVFQSFNLQGPLTALENVMVPLLLARIKRKTRVARGKACLELVGLGERMKHRPSQLSGGQRQRVSIARALANEPKIILADEPTGNLDSAKGQEILQVLQKLNQQGITIIIITHDMEIARHARRVFNLKDGQLHEGRG